MKLREKIIPFGTHKGKMYQEAPISWMWWYLHETPQWKDRNGFFDACVEQALNYKLSRLRKKYPNKFDDRTDRYVAEYCKALEFQIRENQKSEKIKFEQAKKKVKAIKNKKLEDVPQRAIRNSLLTKENDTMNEYIDQLLEDMDNGLEGKMYD